MSIPTVREQQLAEILNKVREYREDAAKCTEIATQSMAEAARSNEMADRWEATGRAILHNSVPGLDVRPGDEVPF